MKKLLVYLDQSYVSSMANQATGVTRPEHAAAGRTMGRLLDTLRTLVDQDKILCPSSAVHDQELGFDDRLEGGNTASLAISYRESCRFE